MSEYCFNCYNGHLSIRFIKQIERMFPEVSVINYTEPGTGKKRGWFAGPNRGNPFDQRLASAVGEYTRSHARGKDSVVLEVEPCRRVCAGVPE